MILAMEGHSGIVEVVVLANSVANLGSILGWEAGGLR
jgi:hypothetical protein